MAAKKAFGGKKAAPFQKGANPAVRGGKKAAKTKQIRTKSK